MQNSNDKDLVSAFRDGSDKALSRLYDTFHAPLYFFVQRIVDNTGEAEEIVADSFVKLWKLRTRFESVRNIKAFLYISARNACFDFLKDKKRLNTKKEHLQYFLDQVEDDFLLKAENSPLLHDEIKAGVLQQILTEAEGLPQQCRKIFMFSFIHGFKNAEIAEKMGLTLQTVKNQKTRALKLLKVSLAGLETQLSLLLFTILL